MRIGVIGCGDIAQLMHIPYLVELPGAELTAVADPMPSRADAIGETYDVLHRYRSAAELVDGVGATLDGVLVTTPAGHHASAAITALRADLHTFVEKPISISLDEADRMVEAAAETDAVAMVGYNKRYDPSFEAMKTAVEDVDEIDLVTVYDVDPDHRRIVDEVYDTVGGNVSEEIRTATQRKQTADAKAVLDTEDDALAADFQFHLEHGCHDINALRELLGNVTRIEHVDLYADGRYATAHLVYEGDVRCTFDSGRSDRKWFEEFIRVDHPSGMVSVEFDNPFIRNAPTTLRRRSGIAEFSESATIPSYEESFKRELAHFLDCAETGDRPRTPFTEARADLRLIADLFREYGTADRHGTY